MYWIVIKDLKTNEFTIKGPVSDDTDWTNKIATKNRAGSDMNIDLEPVSKNKGIVICEYKNEGLSYNPNMQI